MYRRREEGGQPECFVTQLMGLKPGGLISGILQYIGLAFKTSTRDKEHISPIPRHFVISWSRLKRIPMITNIFPQSLGIP